MSHEYSSSSSGGTCYVNLFLVDTSQVGADFSSANYAELRVGWGTRKHATKSTTAVYRGFKG